jgi:hypothetical protein
VNRLGETHLRFIVHGRPPFRAIIFPPSLSAIIIPIVGEYHNKNQPPHSPLRIRPDYGIHALMRQDGFRNITLHPFLSHLPETVPPDETPSAVSGPDKKFQI